jgi:hypothetical protein
MIDQQITDALYNILLTVVTTGTPIVIGYIVNFLRQHASAKQLETSKEIAMNSVTFAEQISKTLGFNNEQKFNSALASAKELASKYGVKLNDTQWKSLIEPALNEAKKGWNDLSSAIVQPEISEATQVNSDAINEVVNVPETVATVGIEGNTTNVKLSVPEDMLNPLYTSIMEKSNQEAINAINGVIENVQKSISPIE